MHAALFSLFLAASMVSAGALPVRQVDDPAANYTSTSTKPTPSAAYVPVFAPKPATTSVIHTTPLYPAFDPIPNTAAPVVHTTHVSTHSAIPFVESTPGVHSAASSSVPIAFAPTSSGAPVVHSEISTETSSAHSSIPTISGNTGYFTCNAAGYLYCCPEANVFVNPHAAGEYGATGCTFTANIATGKQDFAACSSSIDSAVPLCCSTHPGLSGSVTIPDNCTMAVSHSPPVTRVSKIPQFARTAL